MCCEVWSKSKRVLGWILCLSLIYPGTAQDKNLVAIHYRGRIVNNSTGKPIEGARIRFVHSAVDATWRTDSNGGFSFWTSHARSDQITIDREGYRSAWLKLRRGVPTDIQLVAETGIGSNSAGLAESSIKAEILPPSQAVAPAMVTAESGRKLSGKGRNWSRWYRLGIGKAPNGYTVRNVEFWLTGDRTCGLGAECREIMRSNQQILWEFRLQGHDEIGAPTRAFSCAHIHAVYSAITSVQEQ